MKRTAYILLILFTADFAVDSYVSVTGSEWMRYITKGSLMPLLLCFLLVQVKEKTNGNNYKLLKLVCAALVFSFIGDILLIHESALNFISGIGAFLIAQVCYIIFFSRLINFTRSHKLYVVITAMLVAAYVGILNYLFWPLVNKQNFVIPVLAYSMVLGVMLFTAVNTYNSSQWRQIALRYFIPGAIFFVASDSMIALNRFYLTKPVPGFYIMLTYCIAQLMIVMGARRIVR